MAALINDIATAKRYVKLMFTNQEASIADMASADNNFIIPITGPDLYAEMLAQLPTPNETFAPLIEFARRAAGPLAYWQDLPTIQARIGDTGIHTVESANTQPLHRWEYEALEESLLNKGCQALEQLLQYLYDHKTDFSWQIPDDYKSIFLTGADFTKYFTLYQPYRTFLNLRAIVKQVEEQYIHTAIGEDFFIALRDKTELGAEETKAVGLIKKAVANLAIKTAIEILPVRISAHGFTVLLQRTTDRLTDGQANAPEGQMSLMYKSVQRSGDNYLIELVNYLNAKASDSLFTDYRDSDLYKPPVTTPPVDPNDKRNGIFAL